MVVPFAPPLTTGINGNLYFRLPDSWLGAQALLPQPAMNDSASTPSGRSLK